MSTSTPAKPRGADVIGFFRSYVADGCVPDEAIPHWERIASFCDQKFEGENPTAKAVVKWVRSYTRNIPADAVYHWRQAATLAEARFSL